MICERIEVPFVCNFALRKFEFTGGWSATPKNRGRSKKTQGRRALKNGGAVVWQWVVTFIEAVPPPPPPPPSRLPSGTASTDRDKQTAVRSPWSTFASDRGQR